MSERKVYPNNPVMAAAWASFVDYASRQPEAIRAFEEATGRRLPRFASNGIDAMIDAATGYDPTKRMEEWATSFAGWVTLTQWGEDPFADESEDSNVVAHRVATEATERA